MINNNVVVLGPDHYNTLWLVRSLGMAGHKPFVIIHSRHNKSFVSKSIYLNGYIIIRDKENIIRFLLEQTGKKIIFTSSDELAELLDQNYNILSSKYFIQNCNYQQGSLSYWMDKNKMVVKAADCGLTTPISLSLQTYSNRDISMVKYPCIVKPELSAKASKDNFRLCNNVEELNQAIQEVKSKCARILVQEYIKPKYEYLIYGVSTDTEICIPGGLRKIHTCSSLNNLGMMSYSCLSNEIPKQIGSLDKIKDFIKAIGYKGLFSVEFIITDDKAYFLEINLRNDGTCYITTQAGVNMPAIWAYSCMGKDSSKLSRSFVRKDTYGMNEVNYFKYTFKLKHFIRCVKEILKTKAFSLIKINDMKPVAYKTIISGLYIPISNYIRKFCRGGVKYSSSISYNQQRIMLLERRCAA